MFSIYIGGVFYYTIINDKIYVVKKEKIIPYPTIATLNLGARPAIDAIAPAVIIGAIPASKIEAFPARLSQPNK